jgi:hypothetical protein
MPTLLFADDDPQSLYKNSLPHKGGGDASLKIFANIVKSIGFFTGSHVPQVIGFAL